VNAHEPNQSWPPLCHRCGVALTPGEGNFYVVRIEAFADPTPPDLDRLPEENPAEEMERLIEQCRNLSEQELLDQVRRQLTVHLCGPCFRQWIEDPTGSP